MSNDNPTPRPDTRPDFMLDPTITDFDKSVVAAFENGDVAMLTRTGNGEDGVVPPADPSTAPAPSPADAPVTGGADNAGSVPPGSTQEGTQPPTAPSTETTPPPSGNMTLHFGEETYELTPEVATELLSTAAWLQNLPPDVVQGLALLEQGQAVALPHEEYARFQAWKQSGAPATQAPAPVRPDSLAYADPEVAAYVERLEAQTRSTGTPVASQGTPQGTPQAATTSPFNNPAYDAAQANAIAVQRQAEVMRDLETAKGTFKAQYGLTDEQVEYANRMVAEARIIPTLVQNHTLKAPTGSTIREADFATVMREAYEHVMATDPTLRQVRDDVLFNQRLAQQQEVETTTAAKKARAGSLATAPSAAVPSGQQQGPLQPHQVSAGIAAALREAQANGSYGN